MKGWKTSTVLTSGRTGRNQERALYRTRSSRLKFDTNTKSLVKRGQSGSIRCRSWTLFMFPEICYVLLSFFYWQSPNFIFYCYNRLSRPFSTTIVNIFIKTPVFFPSILSKTVSKNALCDDRWSKTRALMQQEVLSGCSGQNKGRWRVPSLFWLAHVTSWFRFRLVYR